MCNQIVKSHACKHEELGDIENCSDHTYYWYHLSIYERTVNKQAHLTCPQVRYKLVPDPNLCENCMKQALNLQQARREADKAKLAYSEPQADIASRALYRDEPRESARPNRPDPMRPSKDPLRPSSARSTQSYRGPPESPGRLERRPAVRRARAETVDGQPWRPHIGLRRDPTNTQLHRTSTNPVGGQHRHTTADHGRYSTASEEEFPARNKFIHVWAPDYESSSQEYRVAQPHSPPRTPSPSTLPQSHSQSQPPLHQPRPIQRAIPLHSHSHSQRVTPLLPDPLRIKRPSPSSSSSSSRHHHRPQAAPTSPSPRRPVSPLAPSDYRIPVRTPSPMTPAWGPYDDDPHEVPYVDDPHDRQGFYRPYRD